ncbi:hypothetical protein L226DRAFT_241799 [Lentinus tigrinus ALCF2SS1-7]|uniref:uncharacterized protein n=1 Tax=Lentinus tigrinus ALCF2SS1-7 TaxID=1328758 RepID=UPI00116623A4|nr:hypothetical protein L226DRAFT_241799 [Lentinus tigrinus ALCF2SS1-7]
MNEKLEKFRRIKDARTATIGSTCYGAGRPESDLDLCIFDRDRVHGFEPTISMSNLPPIYDVSAIAHVLTQAGYKAVSCIPAATIPIVKLTDPETGLSCDMNVNRRLGVYNTRLFRRYCLVFSPLAPLLRKVKGWTRHIGLNHPSTPGVPPSFSSYALTLMTIAGLQRSGYLPNLQADTRKSVNTHFWEVSKTGERYKVDIRYGKGDQWRHIRLYSLDDVFRAWFRYWGFEHNYQSTSTVLSIRDGGLVRWGSATNLPTGNALHGPRIDYDDPKEYRLVVLDPFIPKNCTGRIQSGILKLFQRACRAQYAKLDGVSSQELRAKWEDLLIPPIPVRSALRKINRRPKDPRDAETQFGACH